MAEGAHILVVEDHPVNRELIADVLTGHGFEVSTAETALQAFEFVRERTCDVILMDISLPGMDGLEATRHLKSNPTTAAIPIIALTAHALEGDAERSQAAGCLAHVTKPFRIPDLLTAVEQALQTARPGGEA